jgi:hypothetical protein
VDGSADGNAEICVVRLARFFVPVTLGFLAAVARGPLRRLPVFFVMLGPSDSTDG